MRRASLTILLCALVAALSSGSVCAQARPEPGAALAAYVAKPDDSYAWHVRRRYPHADADVLELTLASQTWQGVLWQHQLLLVQPRRVRDPAHAALIVGGGRWRAEYAEAAEDGTLPEDGELFVAIARALRSTVVVVGQVPFQPLFDLTEDRLIAHTFERYVATGDPEWPLLLPMVKSAVRALDASSAAATEEWGAPLERFTVLGGSKRGWTAWLTAAVEPRVTALAPVVIDALNMEQHFPHQTEVWGAPSEEIEPYTALGLHEVLGSAAGANLRAIVDPYSYRKAIKQPKLVVLATNDRYFPLDSANLYWDGLVGPKYLLYLPNEQHSIERYEPLVRTLRALHAAAGGGTPLPNPRWEYRADVGGLELCVRSNGARRVRVWRAESAGRDFRDAVWAVAEDRRSESVRFAIARPAGGYAAVFAEADYGRGLRAFGLSTNLAVVAAADAPPYGTEPGGDAGVCASLEER